MPQSSLNSVSFWRIARVSNLYGSNEFHLMTIYQKDKIYELYFTSKNPNKAKVLFTFIYFYYSILLIFKLSRKEGRKERTNEGKDGGGGRERESWFIQKYNEQSLY